MVSEPELEVLKYERMVESRDDRIKALKIKLNHAIQKSQRMNCWNCGSELIWGGDHDFDDYHMDGKGIVANFTCSNPDCNTYVESYYTISEDG
tara:strand:+ start:760 stop:1038 length:279 start_codon:yes stop_codon:yes gene_type:complete